jgi:hypothetical protein
MAVTTTTTRHSFNGSGAQYPSGGTPIGQGPFSINFTIIDADHITVYWTKGASGSGTPTTISASGNLTINEHYTVQKAGTGSNATITWIESGWTQSSQVTFPTSSDLIVITRNVPLTQVTNYQNNATIDAETIEQSFDKLTQTTQQLDDGKDYSFKFASNIAGTTGFETNADTATTLNVAKAGRLNKALKFDANGDIGVSTYDPDTYADTADTYRNDALDHRDTAEDYAIRTAGVVRHFDGATGNVSDTSPADQTGVYSSKEWAVGTQSGNTDGSAKQWALGGGSFVSGTAVSGSDYSAKEHAIGTTVSTGSAKQWATKDSTAVDTLYSAKEYASGDATASGGSAKAWATDSSSPDGTSEKSAKTYASEASASATSASNSASVAQATSIAMAIALG